MGYILGVDGGNTKTDYFLYDTKKGLIGMHRGGTCSHEGLKDSFMGTYRVMKEVLDSFLPQFGLSVSDIKSQIDIKNYNFNVNVLPTDKILTLSTCSNNGTKRLVIHAVLIEKPSN